MSAIERLVRSKHPALHQVLQPLHLQADGGLGQAERLAGGGEAAALRDGDEAAEQVEVEVGDAHGMRIAHAMRGFNEAGLISTSSSSAAARASSSAGIVIRVS